MSFPVESLHGSASAQSPAVFRVDKGVRVASERPRKNHVATARRMKIQEYYRETRATWQGLTAEQKEGWYTWAELMQRERPSAGYIMDGHTWHLKLCMQSLVGIGSAITDAPAIRPPWRIEGLIDVQWQGANNRLLTRYRNDEPPFRFLRLKPMFSPPLDHAGYNFRSRDLVPGRDVAEDNTMTTILTSPNTAHWWTPCYYNYSTAAYVWTTLQTYSLDWWPGQTFRWLWPVVQI